MRGEECSWSLVRAEVEEGPFGRSCNVGGRQLLQGCTGSAQTGREREGPLSPTLICLLVPHGLKSNGHLQIREPTDKVFKDQHPRAWNRV